MSLVYRVSMCACHAHMHTHASCKAGKGCVVKGCAKSAVQPPCSIGTFPTCGSNGQSVGSNAKTFNT